MSAIQGHISQIIGPVIDVFFDTEGKDAEQCVNFPRPEEIINIVNKILQNYKHSV